MENRREIPREALFCPRKTHTPLLRHGAKENLLIPGHKSDSSPPKKRKETKTFFRHSKSGKVAFLHVWSVWQSRGLLFFSFPFPKNSVEIMESIFSQSNYSRLPNPPKGVSFEPEKTLGNKNCTNSFHLSCLEIGFVFFSLRNKISLLILFSFPYISHFPSCLHCEEGRTKFRIPRWNKRDRRDGLGRERERKGKAKQTLKSHFFLFHPSPFHFMQMPLWSNNGIQFSFFLSFLPGMYKTEGKFSGEEEEG